MIAATITWIVLIAATLGSFAAAELLPQRSVAVAAILLVAAFKVRLIVHHYMDLGSAPFSWRTTFDVWILGCAIMIFGLA